MTTEQEINSNITRVVTPAGIFEVGLPTPRMSEQEPVSHVFEITEVVRDDGDSAYLIGCIGPKGSELDENEAVLVSEVPKAHAWRVDQIMHRAEYRALVAALAGADESPEELGELAVESGGERPQSEPSSLFETVSTPTEAEDSSHVG